VHTKLKPLPRRWPKGTWMRLVSRDILRAFVGPEDTKKISGRKLARAAGCHPSFIDHLLTGRRRSCTPVMANRIAEVLAVPVEVLFTPEIPPNKRQTDARRAPRRGDQELISA
jgi:hypothetical protein